MKIQSRTDYFDFADSYFLEYSFKNKPDRPTNIAIPSHIYTCHIFFPSYSDKIIEIISKLKYTIAEIIKNFIEITCLVTTGVSIPIAKIIFARLNKFFPNSLDWFLFNLSIFIIYNRPFKKSILIENIECRGLIPE